MRSPGCDSPSAPTRAGTHRMALVQFSAFCAPVAAKGRAEGLRSLAEDNPPAQGWVLGQQPVPCSCTAHGPGALPFEAIKFSA